nr:PREDICTED: coiled-coil domain-containing protein 115 isoform X2 [Fragaria vesca subsp. vesca]
MEAQSLKEDNPKLQSLEEDPKSKGLEEEDTKSQGLKEEGFKSQEDLKSQRVKEEEHKSQRLKGQECKSHSTVEELKLNSLEEEEPILQSVKKEEPKSQSLEEEEEDPKLHSLKEGQDSLGHPRFNENALQFLDSMDGYLTLLDSLSWTLRQGWLQLASARHSMGGSRVSSAVLDMKPHSAATYLQVSKQSNPEAGLGEIHQFTLLKWASSDNGNGSPRGDDSPQLRQRKDKVGDSAPVTAEDDYEHQLQKERFKSLSVFGALVSPKLRAAQLSFETALEALVEIANMRSLMLSNFHEVRKEMESANGKQ